MQRISITPRNNWKAAVEKLGFGFHSTDVPYWNESAYYKFSMDEILFIENASVQLWGMCLEAVQYVIDNGLYAKMGIPEKAIELIERSWSADHPAIYNRFDLGFDGTNLKLFEINADTPTSLFEGGIIQWFWLQDFDKNKDQFNSIHEKLINYWKVLGGYLNSGKLHFTCVKGSLEDLTNTEYMRDCAMQAGLSTQLVYVDDIGYDQGAKAFVGMENEEIHNIFKLYPWEWMINEKFADFVIATKDIFWIEPAWKMILSNKAILPILWELFPECPFILECYFEQENKLTNFVKKPFLSREGANISIIKGVSNVIESTGGEYGTEGYICQQIFDLPVFNGKRPVLGSWVIGQEAAGMGIRESETFITGNTSCFVPHLIDAPAPHAGDND